MVAIERAGPAARHTPRDRLFTGLDRCRGIVRGFVAGATDADVEGGALPAPGVQFTGMLAAHETSRWFTSNWRERHQVAWWVLPTTIGPGAPQLRWDVALERASGDRVTYWLTVTNLTDAPVAFEGRYTVLGSSD